MNKKILFFVFIIFSLFTSKFIIAQGSDFQCTPTDLGFLTLASPPCSSGTGFALGTAISQTGTTIGATNDSLSGMITSCHSGPALHDVWYSFRSSENHVQIQIQGFGTTPLTDSYVAIYEALTGECVGLIPRGCSMGAGIGPHNMEFGPLTFGVKYYIQIASGTATGDGNFNLVLRSKSICSDCSKNSVLNAYPLPVNAAYPPDTTVGFCYSVIGYNELYGNRLHGVVPLLGSGWDATTLTVYSAADSADFAGQWKWFNNINVGGTSGIVSGFFYDVGGDNDPTNNLGDNGVFSTIWTFCFTIKTHKEAFCNAGQNDLSIRFLNFSDGESGSLISTYDCSGDEDYVFDAHMECCPKPYGVVPFAAGCNNSTDGSLLVYAGFSLFGHNYFLYDDHGLLVATYTSPPASTAPYTFTGLSSGNYYLYFNENKAGACQTAVNAFIPGPIEYDIQQLTFGCPSATACTNSAAVVVTSGSASSISWSSGESGPVANLLCTGWNYVTIVDTGIVACSIVDSVYITNLPFTNPNFAYNKTTYCTSDTFAIITDFPSAGGGTFTLLAAPLGIFTSNLNSSTGIIYVSTALNPGQIIIKYSSPPPCVSSHIDTLYIEMSPQPPLASMFPDQELCVGDIANSYLNSSSFDIDWYNDTALTTLVTTHAIGSSYDFFSGSPITAPGYYPFFLRSISTTNSCKSIPTAIAINVYPLPVVDAGLSSSICPGFGITLNSTGANSYLWSPGSVLNDPNISNPLATLSATTLFTVVGTDASPAGCFSSDTVTVFVDENGACDIVFYNGFTPNGDNNNDYWFIDGISVDPKNQVTIFNRWGDKIWETVGYDNADKKWDGRYSNGGKLVPDGTYFFVVNFKDKIHKGYIEISK